MRADDMSNTSASSLQDKWEVLSEYLQKLAHSEPLAIAYSGGLDSRFLAFAANKLNLNPRLVHVCGAHMSPQDTQEAMEFARQMQLDVQICSLSLPSPQQLALAGKERCYVCKRAIFLSCSKW